MCNFSSVFGINHKQNATLSFHIPFCWALLTAVERLWPNCVLFSQCDFRFVQENKKKSVLLLLQWFRSKNEKKDKSDQCFQKREIKLNDCRMLDFFSTWRFFAQTSYCANRFLLLCRFFKPNYDYQPRIIAMFSSLSRSDLFTRHRHPTKNTWLRRNLIARHCIWRRFSDRIKAPNIPKLEQISWYTKWHTNQTKYRTFALNSNVLKSIESCERSP